MTERGLPIVDGAPACPFVAFADDRDERATSPDHRHRCYAEPEPAPRALAHQEAYCLSSAFPVCPTFQDWARREAARTRAPQVAPAGPVVGATDPGPAPRRNPPRDWAAPPPWLGSGDADAEGEGPEVRSIPARAGGLAGSYADQVASGGSPGHPSSPGSPGGTMAETAPGHGPAATPEGPGGDREATHAPAPRAPIADVAAPRAAGPYDAATDRGGRRTGDAPEWERPRRLEEYPAIRSRRLGELSVSPVLIAFVALLLAAAGLFALPGLLGFGGPGPATTPTPTPGPAESVLPSLGPTPVPQPTQTIYVVQQGDTMSRIADRFGIPLQVLIDANAQNIPDPNRLPIGDQVIIPAGLPTEIPAEVPAAT